MDIWHSILTIDRSKVTGSVVVSRKFNISGMIVVIGKSVEFVLFPSNGTKGTMGGP